MEDTLVISYNVGSMVFETPDPEVVEDKAYYELGYHVVVPREWDDPNANGWYELVDGVYSVSSDTEVDPEKDYYETSFQEVEPEGDEDPSELGWYETQEGDEYTELESTLELVPIPTSEIQELEEDEEDDTEGE